MDRRNETLDKKEESLDKREDELSKRQNQIDEMNSKVEEIVKEQQEELERISGFTKEDAREIIMKTVSEELTHERAVLIKDSVTRAKEEADKKAKDI
ncbi:ribonuclease, partial [Pseudomonas sp. 2822-17]